MAAFSGNSLVPTAAPSKDLKGLLLDSSPASFEYQSLSITLPSLPIFEFSLKKILSFLIMVEVAQMPKVARRELLAT